MQVSVAMATYNGAAYLAEQLASIGSQTQAVNQVVIVDDGSTDATFQIAQEFFQSARPPAPASNDVCLRNEHTLGVSRNFQLAISQCVHGLVALADQDDIWRPDKIARMSAHFESHQQDLLLFTNARNVNEAGEPLGHTLFQALELTRKEKREISRGNAFAVLLRRNVATGATVMFRRRLFDLAPTFPSAWLHDEWLAIVAAAHQGIALLDDQLIDYRQHSSNQIGLQKKTLAQKAQKFSESYAERSARLLSRAEQLNEFVRGAEGVPLEYQRMAAKKLAFETARFQFPSHRLLRLPFVMWHLLIGNYFRFGTGLKDAARNALQPA